MGYEVICDAPLGRPNRCRPMLKSGGFGRVVIVNRGVAHFLSACLPRNAVACLHDIQRPRDRREVLAGDIKIPVTVNGVLPDICAASKSSA